MPAFCSVVSFLLLVVVKERDTTSSIETHPLSHRPELTPASNPVSKTASVMGTRRGKDMPLDAQADLFRKIPRELSLQEPTTTDTTHPRASSTSDEDSIGPASLSRQQSLQESVVIDKRV
jgi:hypothetical protein